MTGNTPRSVTKSPAFFNIYSRFGKNDDQNKLPGKKQNWTLIHVVHQPRASTQTFYTLRLTSELVQEYLNFFTKVKIL